MTLTKRQIARAIHEAEPAISISEAMGLVDTIIGTVKSRLERGEKVMITNFGTFQVSLRAARRGINPATGEPMTIAEHRAIAFTPAPALQAAVND